MSLARTEESKDGRALPPDVKVRMLQQMAAALEDEAGGLYRRMAAFEEEEFLLTREIEERQTEINRLNLKLDAIRSERSGLLDRARAVMSEAAAMREQVWEGEEAMALLVMDGAQAGGEEAGASGHKPAPRPGRDEGQRGTPFFHRTTLGDFVT
jgi:chromosome segregation ATPase